MPRQSAAGHDSANCQKPPDLASRFCRLFPPRNEHSLWQCSWLCDPCDVDGREKRTALARERKWKNGRNKRLLWSVNRGETKMEREWSCGEGRKKTNFFLSFSFIHPQQLYYSILVAVKLTVIYNGMGVQ